jgi:Ca2+-binding EF-hand superfamily protein
MAHEQETKQLEEKVSALVQAQFGGDNKKAFEHNDANHDGKVGKDELMTLLHDAGIGNFLTRSTWAAGVIEQLDTDGDGSISWPEFESVFTAGQG